MNKETASGYSAASVIDAITSGELAQESVSTLSVYLNPSPAIMNTLAAFHAGADFERLWYVWATPARDGGIKAPLPDGSVWELRKQDEDVACEINDDGGSKFMPLMMWDGTESLQIQPLILRAEVPRQRCAEFDRRHAAAPGPQQRRLTSKDALCDVGFATAPVDLATGYLNTTLYLKRVVTNYSHVEMQFLEGASAEWWWRLMDGCTGWRLFVSGHWNWLRRGYPDWWKTSATRGCEPRRPKEGTPMDVEITVKVDGREVACLHQDVVIDAVLIEEQTEHLKARVGTVVLETGLAELGASLRRPCCCGKPMINKGRRTVTLMSLSGEITVEKTRYRCRVCGDWQSPEDAVIRCGRHRVTRHLAKQVCQLATMEHFTRLEQLVADQHNVHLSHDEMLQLVHDVGGTVDRQRQAQARHTAAHPSTVVPKVRPARIYVSCDGIFYCTNQREPCPAEPDLNRLIWRQMRVGCVYWQD